jgi:hypothetical protein
MNEQQKTLAARLEKIGGNLWEKGGHCRVYFNNAPELIGLTYTKYKTGNISSARLNGEQISNSECSRMLDRIGRVYYDLNTDKICGTGSEQEMLSRIAKIIRARLAETE